MQDLTNELLLEKIGLVADKLAHLGGGTYRRDVDTDSETQIRGLVERDFGIEEWDWPQGVGLFGLLKLQHFFGDGRFDAFFFEWYRKNFAIGLPSRNVNTTAPFLTLLDLADRTGNASYMHECEIQARWLMEELPRTRERGFQHVTSAIGNRNGLILNEGQLWIDTLFMAVLFLNDYGQRCGRKEYAEEAVHQFLVHIKYLYEKKTGLFYHGWSFDRNDNFGNVFWCRGNSWFTLGVAEFLADDRTYALDPAVRSFLIDTFTAQVSALAKYQRPSGLWTTVIDDPSSYEEVSGTAGIAAGIYRGLKTGILDERYRPVADRALRAVCDNISSDGTVENVSAGTAIGMDARFYRQILIRPMAYGQALALIALSEALR